MNSIKFSNKFTKHLQIYRAVAFKINNRGAKANGHNDKSKSNN